MQPFQEREGRNSAALVPGALGLGPDTLGACRLSHMVSATAPQPGKKNTPSRLKLGPSGDPSWSQGTVSQVPKSPKFDTLSMAIKTQRHGRLLCRQLRKREVSFVWHVLP